MRGRILLICLLLCCCCFNISVQASHIVGGEITYKNIGNDSILVFVSIYEDCLNGSPDAIAQDNPAYIRIFKGGLSTGNNFPYFPSVTDSMMGFVTDSIYFNFNDPTAHFIVPTNFSNECVKNPPATCLRKTTFTKAYYCPPDPQGYILVYQRCCRNASILNLANPSSIGATYYCLIPPSGIAAHNNSAVFKNYPPQIICMNEPLFYDHSATDADGDSLSYEFCDTYAGGSDTNSKPVPEAPPFQHVKYINPFSFTNPMAGYPQVQIDPVKGTITGTPKVQGRFVVTVCCHEWRNGILINTVKREFQFVVTNCSKAVVADIPLLSNEPNTYVIDCADYTVHFLNTSVGGFSWFWTFGEHGATSTDFEPTHVYSDTGIYIVRLIVNKGSTCPDSIARIVKVYPSFKSAFDVSGTQCVGATLSFFDSTSATYKPINYWEFRFGDGDTAFQQNPTHVYSQGGEYNVVMISANTKGCSDTSLRHVIVDRFRPYAGNDTVIVQNERINFVAYGGTKYTWSSDNLNYLSNDTIYNPVGYFPDTGRFLYNLHVVSPFGCVGDTMINVRVVPYASFFMPTAFTPNGDGRNDILRPVTVGYRAVKYFRIYNRFGQLIYNSDNIEKGWDGTFNGQKAELGIYFWDIILVNRYGNTEYHKGDVTLIR